MTTKAQAVKRLAELGFCFDENVTGNVNGTWMATIDAIGRKTIEGDCRGIAVHDHTASASEFWAECIREAETYAPYLGDCPHPPGQCDMHDLHDDRCATRKGYPCNCPSAVFL